MKTKLLASILFKVMALESHASSNWNYHSIIMPITFLDYNQFIKLRRSCLSDCILGYFIMKELKLQNLYSFDNISICIAHVEPYCTPCLIIDNEPYCRAMVEYDRVENIDKNLVPYHIFLITKNTKMYMMGTI